MSKRIAYIDIGAGIMILWMLVYHALLTSYVMEAVLIRQNILSDYTNLSHVVLMPSGNYQAVSPSVVFPYLHFLMPWFFYKSGQLFHKRAIGEHVKKDAAKLLLPYILWSVIGFAVYVGFRVLAHDVTYYSLIVKPVRQFIQQAAIPMNGSLWFLPSLIVVRLLADMMLPDSKQHIIGWRWIVMLLLGYVVAYAAWKYNTPNMPYWVGNIAAGLAFFCLGYGVAQYETKWWMLIPCAMVCIACCVCGHSMVVMKTNELLSGNYMLNIPTSFAAIVVFNSLCRIAADYFPRLFQPIEMVGKNAMSIFLVQGILYRVVMTVLMMNNLTTWMPYAFWFVIGTYIIFIPPVCLIYNYAHRQNVS